MSAHPPEPNHVAGTPKGEEMVRHHGREAGRQNHNAHGYRSARDSTSIDPESRAPIDPAMPNLPPS